MTYDEIATVTTHTCFITGCAATITGDVYDAVGAGWGFGWLDERTPVASCPAHSITAHKVAAARAAEGRIAA